MLIRMHIISLSGRSVVMASSEVCQLNVRLFPLTPRPKEMNSIQPSRFMKPSLSSPILRLLIGSLLAVLMTLLSGCQTTPASQAKSEGNDAPAANVLRVGVTPNMPPFVFIQDGKLVGLEVDFAIALGNELGMKVQFVRMDWEDLIPALRRNKIDIIMSGMNYNPERAAIISFVNPYVRSGQRALVLQKNVSKYPIPGFVLMTKEKVGAESSTTGAFLVRSDFPKATMKTYSSPKKGAEAVISGEIEMFIHDAPTVFWMAGIYQSKGLTVAPPLLSEDLMAWAVNRENTDLLNAVNAVRAQWNSTGAIDAVLSRWVQM